MDAAGTVASIIAIRGGVIAYVGNSLGTACQQFTDRPQAIDLGGKVAVPGLIDCHNHFVVMGNRPGHHTPLENAYSVADIQALYRQRAATLPASPNPPVGGQPVPPPVTLVYSRLLGGAARHTLLPGLHAAIP